MKGGKDSGFGQFSGSKGPSAFKSTQYGTAMKETSPDPNRF